MLQKFRLQSYKKINTNSLNLNEAFYDKIWGVAKFDNSFWAAIYLIPPGLAILALSNIAVGGPNVRITVCVYWQLFLLYVSCLNLWCNKKLLQIMIAIIEYT